MPISGMPETLSLAKRSKVAASRGVPEQLKFLVIDEDNDSRFLLVKTLLRKFPGAGVTECRTADAALSLARTDKLNAIVTHRTAEMTGVDLVRELRSINPA